ncbi:Uncharacterised protein [Mycobacteroides abscessus subsp. massiliense]|nr:Uncharacterised protein [Mycobacteroides abscessus subsp. massiliense]
MLSVDERGDTAGTLCIGDGMQSHGGLTRGLRTIDLDDAATGQTADAERHVQCDGAGRDHGDGLAHLVAEPHDRALAEALVDLCERELESLLAIRCLRHGVLRFVVVFEDRVSDRLRQTLNPPTDKWLTCENHPLEHAQH